MLWDLQKDFQSLKVYYKHQYKLLQSFEKDPIMFKENSDILLGCIDEIQLILNILKNWEA